MLRRIPQLAKNWSKKHRNFLFFISGASLASFAGAVVYATLPVIIAISHGEWYAGVLVSACSFMEAMLIDPIAGGLSDRIGSRKTVMAGFIIGILAGILWLTLPMQNVISLIAVCMLLYVAYGFRESSETYVLRTVKQDEGGMAFGLFGNINSLAIFLATASLPLFILSGHEAWAAWVLIATYGLSFLILLFLPDDIAERKGGSFFESMNPVPAIRNGWKFIKINRLYPMLIVGAAFFEGMFYGTIWFIFPIHLAKAAVGGGSGFQLGIYDLVTALFAGYAGYLADRYNWRHTHSIGWIFVILGLMVLPFYELPAWLIMVGFIIAVGNNLSYYAASHALEANDIDHKEDGEFIGLKNIITNLGWAISPLIAGFLYSRYGFTFSLVVNSSLCILIALAMVWLTWKLEAREPDAKRLAGNPTGSSSF